MLKELFGIYIMFFRMGAVTFGGGYAMLPILRREIVENKAWLSEEDVMDFYAISQCLPGIIAVNVSVFIGYNRKKLSGAIAAALGVVSPCVIIITIIAACMASFQDNIYVVRALSAVSVCVCALILDSILGMWKKGVKDIPAALICVAMLLFMTFTKISPIILVIASAVLGIVLKGGKEGKAQSSDKGGDAK